jgi:rubrerythrin
MVSLKGSRTGSNLKHAFSDEARFDRLYLSYEQAAEAAGHRDLAVLSRAAATSSPGTTTRLHCWTDRQPGWRPR